MEQSDQHTRQISLHISLIYSVLSRLMETFRFTRNVAYVGTRINDLQTWIFTSGIGIEISIQLLSSRVCQDTKLKTQSIKYRPFFVSKNVCYWSLIALLRHEIKSYSETPSRE